MRAVVWSITFSESRKSKTGDEEKSKRLILLLENLRQGFSQMRLLDLKMGAETSVACWKGKSRLNAWKNSCVDQRTNSAVEGFRLEGIEGPPSSLEKRIRFMEAGVASSKYLSPKVIKRFTLQRLRASEILEFWLDVSHLGVGSEVHAQQAALAAFGRLRCLLKAVRNLEVPFPSCKVKAFWQFGEIICNNIRLNA